MIGLDACDLKKIKYHKYVWIFLSGKKFSSLINIGCIAAAKAEAMDKSAANVKYYIPMELMNLYNPVALSQLMKILAHAWISVQDITIA